MPYMTAVSLEMSDEPEIRTVVNAVLGECIWNLSYNERRMAIELELTEYLEEEDADAFICQFPVPADYDGAGSKGSNLSPRLPLSHFDGAEMFDLMCREHDELSERFNSLPDFGGFNISKGLIHLKP